MYEPTHLSCFTKEMGGISLMIRRVHDSVIAPLSQGEMSRNDETWKNRGPGAQSEQGRIMARRTKGSAPLLRNKSRGPGRPARERSKDDETWKNRGPGAQSEQEKTMVGGIMAPGYCGTNPRPQRADMASPSLWWNRETRDEGVLSENSAPNSKMDQ